MYRLIVIALFVGFAISPLGASAKTWTQTNDSGFGDPQNTAATFFKIWGHLFAVTDNASGVQAYEYNVTDTTWDQITDTASWGFLADPNNVAVSAKVHVHGNTVFLALTNSASGGEVWQIQATGSQGGLFYASQINYDGFGNSGYQSVLHMVKFKNRILVYVQNSGDGSVRVLRNPVDGSRSWEFMTDLPAAYADGLDAVGVFHKIIYLSNHIQAQIYTSPDGRTYSYTTTLDVSGIAEQVNQFVVFQHNLFAVGEGGKPCDKWIHGVNYTMNGTDWKGDITAPRKRFCYTQMIVKSHSNTAYVLGFDGADGVIYRRRGDVWRAQKVTGLNGATSADDDNRKLFDGIWYRHHIVIATKNSTVGTQVWTK